MKFGGNWVYNEKLKVFIKFEEESGNETEITNADK